MKDAAIIVGAGQAGAHAALAMRAAGYAGPVLLIGAEAERPHERPPLSKQMLTAAEEPPVAYFHSEPRYAEHGITLMLGTAVIAIDPQERTVMLHDGQTLAYDKLLLATGGRARRLAVSGGDRVLTLRTLDDARELRRRLLPGTQVACVGAGVIGLEIASSAHKRGCTVTVIEPADRVMGRTLAPEMSAWLAGLHRAAGIALRLGTAVAAVAAQHVVCTDGSLVPADVVIAGIGMERDTSLAVAAGVAVDDGVEVDEFGRTNMPGVYAAGDVAAFWVPRLQRRMRLETWRHAQDHGAAVGRAMAGSGVPYDDVPWFWTDQLGVNLQVAGVCDGAATRILRGELGAAAFAAWYLDAAGVPIGVAGVNAPREVRAGQGMIRARRAVDPARLSDVAITPQRLATAVSL